MPPEKKADMYVKIAQLFLEDGDPIGAETFINRATAPIAECPNDAGIQLRYKVFVCLCFYAWCFGLCNGKDYFLLLSHFVQSFESYFVFYFIQADCIMPHHLPGLLCTYSGLEAKVHGGRPMVLPALTN
jgi:hypothetical protein